MENFNIYELLNITSDLELLEHLPRRYESLEPTAYKDEYNDKERLVIHGRLKTLPMSVRGVKMLRFTILYGHNKSINAFIFGQDYYRYMLKLNQEFVFTGRYSKKNKSFSVTSIVRGDNQFALTGIKPLYRLPKKIKSSDFYKLIKDVVTEPGLNVSEIIPSYFRNKYRLESRKRAFYDVHLPQNWESLNEGLRVFKYEEALKYCLSAICLKEYNYSFKKAVTVKIDTAKINDFIKSLPYQLTHDQVTSIREIVLDMNAARPMNRLLEGDVGTGKTAVAFISLYANYLRSSQGALMVPTLTLARQHYENAIKMFKGTGIRIELFDSGLTKKNKDILSGKIEKGEVDIIIGTHAMISEGLSYFNLGLIIIDEQQRFGVNQRTALFKKGESPDFLMMSATPIPRTITKIMYSDLDVSYLNEFPMKKRSVVTRVIKSKDGMIDDALAWALNEKRQVFVVVPKIEDDEGGKRKHSAKSVHDEYAAKFGEESVGLLHGKMKSEDKERIYDEFKNNIKPILVSTTVIEVGVDVPTAGLMIIYEANYFGLSTLHQLRGRIGRNGEKSVALLVYDSDDESAIERLQYLSKNEDGYKIAEYDLMIRGAGSYIGENQSGESELQVANFIADKKIFECAQQDASFIYEHLDMPDNNVFYQSVRKVIFKAELK